MRTNELTDAALDWAVAKCEGGTRTQINSPTWVSITMPAEDSGGTYEAHLHELAYSTNWAQGGPIIERAEIETRTAHSGGWMANRARTKGYFECGPTPLIAAMRCYVASKLGDNIDIPKELT